MSITTKHLVFCFLLAGGLLFLVSFADADNNGKDSNQAGVRQSWCGLRNSENPTADNLKPQETTKETASDMGADGAGLSCPGSSVVADQKVIKGQS